MEKTFVLHSQSHKQSAINFITRLSLEELHEVSIKPHEKHRTLPQNSFSHAIYADVAKHKGDESPEEIKCYCKLTFGLPILSRSDNKEKAERYTGLLETLEPLSYEWQLKLMRSIPVTSEMTTAQCVEYTEEVMRHYGI